MHRKGMQIDFNSIHNPLNDVDHCIPLPGQYDTNHYSTAATYHPRPETETLLPRNMHSPAKNALRNGSNLSPLIVNQSVRCGSHCSCCQFSPLLQRDSGIENIQSTPSPQFYPYSRFPSTTDTNPSGASMSDIEVAVGDEDGQNPLLHGPGTFSRLSSYSGVNRSFNLNCYPKDNVVQPVPPSTPNTQMIERCSDQCCNNENCRWHFIVRQYPHLIMWQAEVRTIELKKSPSESYGFSYKVKKSQKLKSDEIYVVVHKVEKNGKAAAQGLAVGDVIHSINGDPLQTEEKFVDVDIKKTSHLRMQTQRPLRILDKAEEFVKNKIEFKIPRHDHHQPHAVEPLSPPMSPDQAPMMDKQFEVIPLHSMRRSETRPADISNHLPQVRVFLCGNCTLDFVRCILCDLITISTDTQSFTYQISMEKMADGSVRINNSKAYSCMSDSPISCINVEVIAVLNDNFFHNCCPWMFTPKSVFIMTFDTKKLSLSNDTEMARLSNLAHTILSSSATNLENLRLFGIKPADDDATPEEVQTLFHTSLAASLPQPKIVSFQAITDVASVQEELFNFFGQLCLKQKVHSITNYVIDQLISSPNALLSKEELYHKFPEGISTLPEADQYFNIVMKDLLCTGNLKELGGRILSEEQQEFVIPCKFFDCLSKLIQQMERDPNSWTSSPNFPGLLKELDLLDLIGRVTPFIPKTISYLKELNIMFPIKVNGRDSGFCEGASYLFPYFVKDLSSPIEGDSYQELFTASSITPATAYFHLLSDLSLQEKCMITTIESQSLFRISYDGQELLINLKREEKKIGIFIGRNQKPARQQLLHEFSDIVEKSLSRHTAGKEPFKMLQEAGAKGAEAGRDATRDSSELKSIENNAAVAIDEQDWEFWNQRREDEQRRILSTPLVHLTKLYEPLKMLHEHMTINDNWEKWGGILGLSTEKIAVYRGIIRNTPDLPGSTFCTKYTLDTRCSLEIVLKTLSVMSETDKHCSFLAEELWRVALENNAVKSPCLEIRREKRE